MVVVTTSHRSNGLEASLVTTSPEMWAMSLRRKKAKKGERRKRTFRRNRGELQVRDKEPDFRERNRDYAHITCEHYTQPKRDRRKHRRKGADKLRARGFDGKPSERRKVWSDQHLLRP